MRQVAAVLGAVWWIGCSEHRGAEPERRAPAPVVGAAPAARHELTFTAQTDATDCGPAALATVLTYYDHPTTLVAAKRATGFHGEETSALALVKAAEAGGLGSVGIAVDLDIALRVLRTGDILHFDFNHFVVFDAVTAAGVRIMDPDVGPVVLDRAAFGTHFSGTALLFARNPDAIAARRRALGLRADP